MSPSLRRVFALVAVLAGCSSSNDTTGGDAGGSMRSDAGVDATADAPADAGDASPTDATNAHDGGPTDAGDAMAPDGATSSPPRRTPDEVLLVQNTNSPTSMAIAKAYAQLRGVTNLVSVSCVDSAASSDNETIAAADYGSLIAAPISAYLGAHPAIQFIVLTKGIPIRIGDASTGCCMNGGAPGQPSVDSFLAAIDYPTLSGATEVGISGSGTVGKGWLNRYWNATVPFSHAQFGGYLVTRLDGYTQDDAIALVTEAIAAEKGTGSGPVLFDVDNTHGLGDKTQAPEPITASDYDPTNGVTAEWDWSVWNADMLHARDALEASGIPNQLVMNGTFVGGLTDLLGYFSWGSNDSNFDPSAYASLMFAPGSIGDTAVSTSGRTFLPTSGGQSLIDDLTAHGLTAAKGYVGEPLLQGVASPSIALARYESGWSMAESLYAASRFVGWEDVVLGDPLGTPHYGAKPVVTPTYASAFQASSGGVQTESCSEGSLDVGNIGDGSSAMYKAMTLTGAKTFVARVASAGPGGSIGIYLDSASGTFLGSCPVPPTGDWQTWTTQTCAVTPATGVHDVYLVFTAGGDAGGAEGGGGYLFNVQWFAFRP